MENYNFNNSENIILENSELKIQVKGMNQYKAEVINLVVGYNNLYDEYEKLLEENIFLRKELVRIKSLS